ncbi:hypothetical protein Taro_001741 [Colocasia esculenta]|uniref:Uncharacterized protein n=1 Tax=Colocasia esculenta TaxID=4460 RepID=A0A843TEH1_COLES|nr:hypothetical protein [Colocasia esculenta]
MLASYLLVAVERREHLHTDGSELAKSSFSHRPELGFLLLLFAKSQRELSGSQGEVGLKERGLSFPAEVKKPTSWYKSQCGSTRHKPLARFYTVYSPTAGRKSFLEKKEQS